MDAPKETQQENKPTASQPAAQAMPAPNMAAQAQIDPMSASSDAPPVANPATVVHKAAVPDNGSQKPVLTIAVAIIIVMALAGMAYYAYTKSR